MCKDKDPKMCNCKRYFFSSPKKRKFVFTVLVCPALFYFYIHGIILRVQFYKQQYIELQKEQNRTFEHREQNRTFERREQNRTFEEKNRIFKEVTRPKLDTWQDVSEDGKSIVFSAYLDNIGGRDLVRAIGISNSSAGDIFCRFWSDEETWGDDIILGSMTIIPEHHRMPYKAVFYKCPLPEGIRPVAVSILTSKSDIKRNAVSIVYPVPVSHDFTVCLAALYFDHSVATEMVQWIELNRILGANHFTIYVYKSHPETDRVLNYYANIGIADVIQWNYGKDLFVKSHGQLAQFNDCLYRNFHKTKYLLDHDIDEFIIPRGRLHNWGQLVRDYRYPCELLVRNGIMNTEVKDTSLQFPNKELSDKYELFTLQYFQRRVKMPTAGHRSKYFIQPKCVDTMGIHYVHKKRKNFRSAILDVTDPDDAIVYHYRRPMLEGKGGEVVDRKMMEFKDRLIHNVHEVWTSINNT